MKKYFAKIDKKIWLILFSILIFGSFVTLKADFEKITAWQWQTLRVSKDFTYGSINFYENGYAYPYGPTYPYLIYLSFIIFGTNPVLINYVDLVLINIGLLTIFLLSYFFMKDEKIALLVVIISLFVFHSALINPVDDRAKNLIFFVTSSLLFSLISYQINTKKMYFLTLLIILLAAQAKLENIILLLPFAIGLFLFRKKEYANFWKFFKEKLFLPIILFLMLSGVYVAKASYKFYGNYVEESFFYRIQNSHDIFDFLNRAINYEYNRFQIKYLYFNFIYFLIFWSSSIFLYLIPFFILGIFFIIKLKNKIGIFLIITFIIQNIVYLFCHLPYAQRFALITYPAYGSIVGFGCFCFIKQFKNKKVQNMILFLIVLGFFLWYFPLFNQLMAFDKGEQFDYKSASELLGEVNNKKIFLVPYEELVPSYGFEFVSGQEFICLGDLIRKTDNFTNVYRSLYSEAGLTPYQNYNQEIKIREYSFKQAVKLAFENFNKSTKIGKIPDPLGIPFIYGKNYYIEDNSSFASQNDIIKFLDQGIKGHYKLIFIKKEGDYTLFEIIGYR